MAKWKIILAVFVTLVICVGVPVGIYAIRVVVSKPKGAGDAEIKANSRDNRIFAQEHFRELYAAILTYDENLDQAAKDKREHPGDLYFAVNYSGLVKTCVDARNEYDADANKLTQARWRDPELPYQIDKSDPKTDCKESE